MLSPSAASITIGLFLTASVDNIAICGALMMGAVKSVPNAPLLVMV